MIDKDFEMNLFIENSLDKKPNFKTNLKIGDTVEWVNDYGVKWLNKIIGFNTERSYNKKYKKYVHLDTDAYWFPHDHLKLIKLN
jgi:hypothetical protein|tara:strand:- start:1006 stop:1257 length:252 start_codon:yes stop_codon:yes gene_type:complete